MPTLRFTFFWCKDADLEARRTRLILDAAKEFARTIGFDIEVLPHNLPSASHVLGHSGAVISAEDISAGPQAVADRANRRVRGQAHSAFQANGRLPIIFGKLGPLSVGDYHGQTVMAHTTKSGTVVRSDWLPWCLVDPETAQIQGQTLMHEVGHAAGAAHPDLPGEYPNIASLAAPTIPPSDLMAEGGHNVLPVTVRQETKDLLARSYFCW